MDRCFGVQGAGLFCRYIRSIRRSPSAAFMWPETVPALDFNALHSNHPPPAFTTYNTTGGE